MTASVFVDPFEEAEEIVKKERAETNSINNDKSEFIILKNI